MLDNSAIEILLIEDNPKDVELTLLAFKKNGIANHTKVLTNGEQALEFIFGTETDHGCIDIAPPRLVLLDLKLPKIDGLEVLRRLKADTRTRHIPVVVLTSSNLERDMVESYQYGVNSYIRKPVDFDKFIDVVHHLGLYWLLLNQLPGKDAVDSAARGRRPSNEKA